MAPRNPKATTSTNKINITRSDIPVDIIFDEIIPRFPAKSLFKFRLVSRGWNSVISKLDIASRSILTTGTGDLCYEAIEFYGKHILDSNKFGYSENIEPSCLVSSCNGLLFFIKSDEKSDVDNEFYFPELIHHLAFSYVVYNPVYGVDHFIKIPHPYYLVIGKFGDDDDDKEEEKNNYNFGFGYVSSSNDYYIVVIDSPRCSNIDMHVYSLRSRLWKSSTTEIEEALPLEFQYLWHSYGSGTLVQETLYWGISYGNRKQYIFSVDLAHQDEAIWKLLPRPNFGETFRLCCLDGCLCAWAESQDSRVVEMWMLKGYGVSESWSKLFHFQLDYPINCRNVFGLTKPKMVLLFTSKDELILADFSCDTPILSNAVLKHKFEAVSYNPSLVSVLAMHDSTIN